MKGKTKVKNAAAQAMVAMRNKKLSPARRKQIAVNAAETRWAARETKAQQPLK